MIILLFVITGSLCLLVIYFLLQEEKINNKKSDETIERLKYSILEAEILLLVSELERLKLKINELNINIRSDDGGCDE